MRYCKKKRQRLYIEHLVGQKKFDLVITKDIVCMLAFGSTNSNNKVVSFRCGQTQCSNGHGEMSVIGHHE